ncbi:MAG: Histidine--tRNA ligase [Parcubacteria group bacterium]|nr:Histidine--tRNA ligase [Parcubacteria group bacterium]
MSKLDTAPYKGVRDFYPEDQFIQNYIFGVWRKTLERSGYEEYNASILESTEIYKEKSGEEIVNEQTYTFKDRGDRDVTLRPEMTPTVARMVAARRRELGFPLRWYSIPNLFRYEAPQRGRLREHWQLNADLFGVKTIEADIEMIAVAHAIMKNFGAKDEDFEIRLNTHSSKEDLEQVIIGLKFSGIENVRIDGTLARGQAYYTGVVFEFFDTNPANPRSILGGGRYDNLTALFEDHEMPAVGFGAGDVTIKDFLETHDLLPEYRPATDLFLTLKRTENIQMIVDFYKMVAELQNGGINTATDGSTRENGDIYKAVERLKIPFVSFVDEEALTKGVIVIKNMKTREEHSVTVSETEKIKEIVKA